MPLAVEDFGHGSFHLHLRKIRVVGVTICSGRSEWIKASMSSSALQPNNGSALLRRIMALQMVRRFLKHSSTDEATSHSKKAAFANWAFLFQNGKLKLRLNAFLDAHMSAPASIRILTNICLTSLGLVIFLRANAKSSLLINAMSAYHGSHTGGFTGNWAFLCMGIAVKFGVEKIGWAWKRWSIHYFPFMLEIYRIEKKI